MDIWELTSFVKGHTRKKTLESLASSPKTPTNIAKATELHLSHVSRALRELEERGLVECMTPEATKNRIYRITNKGEEVLERLREIN